MCVTVDYSNDADKVIFSVTQHAALREWRYHIQHAIVHQLNDNSPWLLTDLYMRNEPVPFKTETDKVTHIHTQTHALIYPQVWEVANILYNYGPQQKQNQSMVSTQSVCAAHKPDKFQNYVMI